MGTGEQGLGTGDWGKKTWRQRLRRGLSCNSSRKGAKDAKLAKGREEVTVSFKHYAYLSFQAGSF